ncbi:MAG: M56 family metallopeptidase [Planctomycetota bacterium]|jgi:Tol biopolymer transport system component/beta-lactamase regulating signal transducer with metallopeptidase domain
MIASLSWDRLDAFSFETMRVLLSVLWQSSILLGAAGLLVFALRRRSASLRHRVWTAALLLTPLLPLFTWFAAQAGSPQLHLPILPAYESAAVQPNRSTPSDVIAADDEQESGSAQGTDSAQGDREAERTAAATPPPSPQTDISAEAPRSVHPWAIASIAYAGGLALLLGLVGLGRLRLRRYTRDGRIVTDPRLTGVFETAREQFGLERGCVIVEIANLHAPLTYLTFHPVVALPRGFTDDLSDAELRTIALHELAHVKRNDPLVLNLASIIRAVFFFHPLVWLAAREIATLAEEAADSEVIEATEAPLPYAKMLTRLTEQLTHRMLHTELAVGIVFSKSALLRRIEAILSPRTEQLRHLSFGVLAMTSILILASFVLATAMPLTHVYPTETADEHAQGMSVRHVWELDPGKTVYPGGISRDGGFVSYVDWNYGNLAVHDLRTGRNRMITRNDTTWASTGGWNEESIISPDGKRIAYHWNLETEGNYTLRVINIDGSDMRVLHQDKDVPWARPFDWSPDGKSLLVDFSLGDMRATPDVNRKLALVSVDDGSVTALSEWKGKRGPQMASFSPDGKYVAFDRSTSDTPIPRDIFVIDLSTGHEVAAVEHPANEMYLGWTPDGTRLLFTSDRTSRPSLWTIELSNGRPVGSPVLLKSDFAGFPVGFSTNGSYYYSLWTESRNVSIATLDESGTDFETVPEYASTRHVNATSSSDWSPDGQSLAYKMGSADESRRSVFGIYSMGTGQERIVKPSMHLNLSEHGRLGPVQWSADGQALYVSGTSVPHGRGMYRVDIATGDTRLIVQLQQPRNPQPTPDDKAVYYIRGHGPVIRHDLATGTEEEIHQSTEPMFGLDLSPDGRWLAFYQGYALVVMSVDGGEVREVQQLEESKQSNWGLGFPTWTPDGKYLLSSKRNRELWRVNVETGEEQQIGSEIPGLFRATMHPDGKRMAFTTRRPSSELWVMENFLPSAPEQP